ncbi:hypothetical protein [Hymenobacter armeniacus]|uniref:Carboxypeptidase regulatory-like domain-containing protein n=1 Tax=Hymenobacter armeniacus TaxID=2771358 RepID=A0ABR8JYK0_9BACT|nr:hypothetical protein [Hymenobacter armeniacus]MBD2723044.1 hypothetical protein [Hymenobacter armeniacus]
MTDLSYRVWACNPAAKPGFIQMVDDKGTVYFEQYSSATNFGRKLNFSELPNGKYTILVKIGYDEHRFSVNMQSSSRQWADVEQQELSQRLITMETAPKPVK